MNQLQHPAQGPQHGDLCQQRMEQVVDLVAELALGPGIGTGGSCPQRDQIPSSRESWLQNDH